jgi:hypothetical protein
MVYSQKQGYMKEAAKGSRGWRKEVTEEATSPLKKQNPLVSSKDRTLILCKNGGATAGLREKSNCDFQLGSKRL